MHTLQDKLKNFPSVIGIMDSGIGGISVLNALAAGGLKQALYVADTAYLPYGQQPYEVLLQRGRVITEFFLSKGITTIVVACHTASAMMLADLIHLYPQVTFIDLLVPTIVQALEITKTKKIAVMATSNTVTSGRYPSMIHAFDPEVTVIQQACPAFVQLLESPIEDVRALQNVVQQYLVPILHHKSDTLILGCTHYAFLNSYIQPYAPDIAIVSAASCIEKARSARAISRKCHVDFYVTGDLSLFQQTSRRVVNSLLMNPITSFHLPL